MQSIINRIKAESQYEKLRKNYPIDLLCYYKPMIEVKGDILIAQTRILVPGLIPNIYDTKGRLIALGNLRKLSPEISQMLTQTPWCQLLGEARREEKSVIFSEDPGGLTITVATAADFKFGKRHGKDLRILPKILKRNSRL